MPKNQQGLSEIDTAEDIPPADGAKGSSRLRLLPVAVVLAGLAAFFALGLDEYLSFEMLSDNRQALMDWNSAHRFLAVVLFIGLYFVIVTFSLPGAVWMTLSAGFLFGTVVGSAYAVIGATLGAAAVFLIARYALADYLHAKAGSAVHRMEEGFRENALSYLLFLRLVMVFPFWLVNLVPALLGVPLRTFAIGTFFGIIPGTVVYASIGGGLGAVIDAGGMPDFGVVFEPQFLFPIVGLAILSLIPIAYKRYKARKDETDTP